MAMNDEVEEINLFPPPEIEEAENSTFKLKDIIEVEEAENSTLKLKDIEEAKAQNDEVEEINLVAAPEIEEAENSILKLKDIEKTETENDEVEEIYLFAAQEIEETENSTMKLKDSIYDMPSQKEEEEAIKKKHGGLLPKNPPLIFKGNERAFFDSADWALGKSKGLGPLEALLPKLQPTRRQQIRSLSAYAREGAYEGENQGHTLDDTKNNDHSTDCQTHLQI